MRYSSGVPLRTRPESIVCVLPLFVASQVPQHAAKRCAHRALFLAPFALMPATTMSAPADAATGDARARGNDLFRAGDFDGAASCYTAAIEGARRAAPADVAVLYKNRAACYLKLGRHSAAVDDCNVALDLAPNDPKALFRRAQAYEALDRVTEAFDDLRLLVRVDPANKEAIAATQRLAKIRTERAEAAVSTDSLSKELLTTLLSPSSEAATRIAAGNNLAVMAQSEGKADAITRTPGFEGILAVLDDKDTPVGVRAAALNMLGSIATHRRYTAAVLARVGVDRLVRLAQAPHATKGAEQPSPAAKGAEQPSAAAKGLDQARSAITLLARAFPLEANAALGAKHAPLAVDERMCDLVLDALVSAAAVARTGGLAGAVLDIALNGVVRALGREDVAARFLNRDGLKRLLAIVSSVVPADASESAPSETFTMLSLALSLFHESVRRKEDERFKSLCADFVTALLDAETPEGSLGAMRALCVLLHGAAEVGQHVLSHGSNTDKLIAIARECGDAGLQEPAAAGGPLSYASVTMCVATAEAMALAAGDKKRCAVILEEGFDALKMLYKHRDHRVRCRALVGLCKIGSVGEGAPNQRMLAEGATLKLEKAARAFLVNGPDDARKWAVEGLAYLTLDADVKEALADDVPALKAMFALVPAATGETASPKDDDRDPAEYRSAYADKALCYGLATVLVNLTNSAEKPPRDAQMDELRKIAKEKVPEPHPKDADEFVNKRVTALLAHGIVNALVHLARIDSPVSAEMVSRVFLTLANSRENRGVLVQYGAAKALVPLALKGTPKGVLVAAQALAKIAITTDPNLAFGAQKAADLIRPFVRLTSSESGLQQFEALMALTNIAGMGEEMREKIIAANGHKAMESLQFDDHELIQRAATEGLCNMLYDPQYIDEYISKDGRCRDKIKLWVLLAGAEDEGTRRAASGGLAILSEYPEGAALIAEQKHTVEILKELAVVPNADLQHRSAHTIRNLLREVPSFADRFLDEQGLELLTALQRQGCPPAKECAAEALELLQSRGLITPR